MRLPVWPILLLGMLVFAAPHRDARAAVTIEICSCAQLGAGNLVQYTLSAVGTEQETIHAFVGIEVTGAAHQVGIVDPFAHIGIPTVFLDDFHVSGVHADWVSFNTHLLFERSQLLGTVGAPLSETNDLSTEGVLGLPMLGSFAAPSGFGDLRSSDGTDALALRPEFAGSHVPFLQVVVPRGSAAFLEVTIGGRTVDGEPITERFTHFDSTEPFDIDQCRVVPEQDARLLAAAAMIGLASSMRRRNSVAKG